MLVAYEFTVMAAPDGDPVAPNVPRATTGLGVYPPPRFFHQRTNGTVLQLALCRSKLTGSRSVSVPYLSQEI